MQNKEYPIIDRIESIKEKLDLLKSQYSQESDLNKHIDAYLHSAEYIITMLVKNISNGTFLESEIVDKELDFENDQKNDTASEIC